MTGVNAAENNWLAGTNIPGKKRTRHWYVAPYPQPLYRQALNDVVESGYTKGLVLGRRNPATG
jgi:hypothetical protein